MVGRYFVLLWLPLSDAPGNPYDGLIQDFKSMDVDHSNLEDFDAWLSLAMEVEPLFGPMAHERAFKEALMQAISEGRAFCIRSDQVEKESSLKGGIIISRESNEIAWFAVSKPYRGMGVGRQLLEFAVGQLNPQESIVVETFDASVPEGMAARKLYMDFGFTDNQDGGLNPAGIPTVIMKRAAFEQGDA